MPTPSFLASFPPEAQKKMLTALEPYFNNLMGTIYNIVTRSYFEDYGKNFVDMRRKDPNYDINNDSNHLAQKTADEHFVATLKKLGYGTDRKSIWPLNE